MSTSFERCIDIQELVDMLSKRLGLQDVSRLARTNRKLHELCTPLLFRDLADAAWGQESHSCRLSRLFSTTAGKIAFAWNVQHIRSIDMEVDELVYYSYCLLAIEDATLLKSNRFTSRPNWLPWQGVSASKFIAMTRMTNLTRLTVSLSKSRRRPYTLPSVKTPQATFAQLCRIISLHLGLTSLQLLEVPIMDLREGRLLGRIIAGLSRLERLSITIHCGSGDWYELCSHILFSCPLTLVHLSLDFFEGKSNSLVQTLDGFGREGEDNEDEVADARSREPLVNLKALRLHGIYGYYWNAGIDQYVFAHCPNIKELDLSSIIGLNTIGVIGECIGKECSKIESLNCGAFDGEGEQELLAFRIMGSLPAQQVTRLDYTGSFDSNNSTVTLAMQRHSTTLREIHIKGVDDFYRISASTILRECFNLEVLYLPFNQDEGHYIILDDALEYVWNSTKLRQLTLGIGGCGLPRQHGVQRYYRRPGPMTLTEPEIQQFGRLENLYRRIGTLTALQELDLTLVAIGEGGEIDEEKLGVAMSFPAMLSLGDTLMGRPGFLHHLSGLSKLESLRGSFNVNTSEGKVTVGWNEARWMEQHWPQLREAWFFKRKNDITVPFVWFQESRDDRRVDLWTYR
ncbi:hypothetical protein BGZ95_000070 [Linnemannia exigua]|uniref:F-box domain-containing protein n=1 Tax=Linnemannia exigua TaxID=604196 RepID=A0AAD4DAX3_9FUNG|nr:hypothetical protein BGZ95_000070 [Linnemannia exigua]